MKITLDISEEDIDRIVRALDNQHAYTRSRNLEDSGYKKLAGLFRGFLKQGPGKATTSGKSSPLGSAIGKRILPSFCVLHQYSQQAVLHASQGNCLAVEHHHLVAPEDVLQTTG